MHVCMRACMHVCVRACVHMCVHVCVCVHVSVWEGRRAGGKEGRPRTKAVGFDYYMEHVQQQTMYWVRDVE